MHQEIIEEKIKTIESLINLTKTPSLQLLSLIKNEIETLKNLQKNMPKSKKKVAHTERKLTKTRYHLEDGSTFVTSNDGSYKYFFDATSKSITYEFGNGQIERTFPNGVKEIRYSDGSVYVKIGADTELVN